MQSDINALKTGMDASSGPIKDVVIAPVANQLAQFEATLAYASKLRALENATELLEEDLDAFGEDYGVTRGTGAVSKGVVYFERPSPPVADITIPAGTIVSVPNSTLTFSTVSTVVMYQSLAETYYIPARNRYGIQARIVANLTGSAFNVGVGKITTVSGAPAGISGCYNPSPTTDGTDLESNSALAQRLAAVLRGTDRSSVGGASREILRFDPTIIDVYVAQGTDPLLTRTGTALPRDIYITGFVGESVTEEFTPGGVAGAYTPYTLLNQPVLSISGVYGSDGTPLSYGLDYTLLKDSSDLSGSIQGADKVSFLPGGAATALLPLKVVYAMNTTVQALQTYYDSSARSLLGTDTLIREGVRVPLYISMRLQVLPGYDLKTKQDEISSFILSLVYTQFFGDSRTLIYSEPLRSEIFNSIQGISSLVFTQFSKVSGSQVMQQFYIGSREYIYLDSSQISWA